MFKTFLLSLQHGVEHGKRLCPAWEGAGGCGSNWAVALVCVLWHCSVMHTSQGMALQRLCVLFLLPVSQRYRQGQGPFLCASMQLCSRALFFGVDLPLCRGVAPVGLCWGAASPALCVSCALREPVRVRAKWYER